MLAVCPDVKQVVDDICSGGAKAETEKGDECGGQKGSIPGMGKKDRKKNERILRPLVETQGFRPCTERRDALLEGAHRRNPGGAESGAETSRRISNHGLLTMLKQRKIRQSVANVTKIVAKGLAESS